MASTAWPKPDQRQLLGKRFDRLDGPAKASGTAKYTHDTNLPNMLFAKALWAPHGAAKVSGIDVSAAKAVNGVAQVWSVEPGTEVNYAGTLVAVVAASTEEIAREAVNKIKVEYEVLPHNVDDRDPAKVSGEPSKKEVPDAAGVDEAFKSAEVVSEGYYGASPITHCCLEAHGQAAEFRGGDLYVWATTQNVSGYAGSVTDAAGVPASQVHVECQYMGGGFGSKFGADQWGQICVQLAKQTGKPVKFMLDRDQELMIAGARPSVYGKVRVAAKKDGTVTGWDSDMLASGGKGGGKAPDMPYVFTGVPVIRNVSRGVPVNRGSQRAWRAPGHPQNCLITMSALEDMAAKLGMDALEFFMKNLQYTGRPDVYRDELTKAAEMIDYGSKAHPRGDPTAGPIKRGLGMALHQWGGGGHGSNCDLTVNPDGSVDAKIGTQDLGTGTRTVIGIVVAETLGIPLERVKVNIGSNAYPNDGASGGSTTVGGVSSSARDAATQALNIVLDKVTPELGVPVDRLVARDGKIFDADNPSKSMTWEKACSLLGQMPINTKGSKDPKDGTKLTESGVGGVQMADVSVDIETGVARINEMVAVQDCGLIVNLKTAESQVYGGMIMGITYALYEEAIYDPVTGRMLNPDMEFYKLAGLADVGKLKVHMMTGPGYDDRGVIGLGEPPVISPGAAISNAIANAIGVRVPIMPFTPDRVLAALGKGGAVA
ncbi:MAG: xanthine dehydrogenase family protein molybdopterin-binding subunit [Candidatus Hydrogenedentes bacterium]|nr:xanthine dehydrogenase family protein molybdopterin-binding subunit [Candidatus Hydrogenedentota bacterium]